MNRQLISVVIPTYNRLSTLKRAIDSVLKQSYRPIEIIVIDDASTDNTHDFLRKYIEKIDPENGINLSILTNKKNMWIGATRNKGLNYANGQYIAFLDSDDEWIDEDKLSLQISFLHDNPDYGFVATRIESEKYVSSREPYFSDDENFRNFALKYYLAQTSSWVLRRSIVQKAWYFWTWRSEDLEYLLRVGSHSKCFCLNRVSVKYYYTPGGDYMSWIFRSWLTSLYIVFLYKNKYPYFLTSLLNRIFRPFFTIFWRLFS